MPTAAQKGSSRRGNVAGVNRFQRQGDCGLYGPGAADTGRPHCGIGRVPSRDRYSAFQLVRAGPEAPKNGKLLQMDSADPAFALVAIARQLCLQRDFWKKRVVGYREAPGNANTA